MDSLNEPAEHTPFPSSATAATTAAGKLKRASNHASAPIVPGSRRRRGKRAATPQADQPVATYRVASYVVYPSGYAQVEHSGKQHWCLSVVDAGNGWAIRRGNKCLSIALQWEAERPLELCDSQFVRECRYNEHAALVRARRVVDRLEVVGMTFDEFVARVRTKPVSVVPEDMAGGSGQS